MAAAGGDTIVPTNWGGLIVTAVIVAVVAAATYFGMEFQFGHQGGEEKTEGSSLSVQDVFSASARREVAAAQTARVLTRADLEASTNDAAAAYADDAADATSDWDAETAENSTTAASADDWGSDASSDWDTGTDDWDSTESGDSASNDSNDADDSMQDSATTPSQQVAVADERPSDASAGATKQTSDRGDRDAPVAPSGPVRERPSAEALRDWWSDANGELAIRFAGTLDRGDQVSDGIAVMFSDAVSPSQGNQNISLTTASGQAVNGQWKSSRNPNMLIMDGLQPGRYQLAISASISSQNGKNLNSAANGPVFVY